MRITVLFVLLACLATSLVSAFKETTQPPRKTVGQAVETPKRVKRQLLVTSPYRRPYLYYNRYGYPTYVYL